MCTRTCEQALSSRAFVGRLGSRGQSPTAHVPASLASVPRPLSLRPQCRNPLLSLTPPQRAHRATPEPPAAQASTWQSPAPPVTPSVPATALGGGMEAGSGERHSGAATRCPVPGRPPLPLEQWPGPCCTQHPPHPRLGAGASNRAPQAGAGPSQGRQGPGHSRQSQTWRRLPCKCRGWGGGETTGLRSEVSPGAELGPEPQLLHFGLCPGPAWDPNSHREVARPWKTE